MNEVIDNVRSTEQPCPAADTQRAYYSRLCLTPGERYVSGLMTDLAEIIKDDEVKRKARGTRTTTMPSGYVYLGQFIDHDLTRDGRSVSEAGEDVEKTTNLRTPRLDLDHLYGNNRSDAWCLYDNAGHLLLGDGQSGFDYDLHRQNDGAPVIIDPRNDENLILAQLHVLWSKFHNRLLDLLQARPEIDRGVPGTDVFERTQNSVRWHYQWIVWHDFLPHIVQSAVLRDIGTKELRLFPRRYTPEDDPIDLPVEFTMAAFRFGHSMVQQSYRINSHLFLAVDDILKMTKKGGGIVDRLPAEYLVDWRGFFGRESALLNRGESIDTFVTESLCELDFQIVVLFLAMIGKKTPPRCGTKSKLFFPCLSADNKVSLPCLTLTRGSNACLPSGEDFARHFGYEPIPSEDIYVLPGDEGFFTQEAMRDRTPLWYYLLREASLENKQEPATMDDPQIIQKLGRIGSQIVAETLYQVLSADSDSIFNAGKNWEPPFLELNDGDLFRIRSMLDLVDFVRAK